ncbi:MAG: hypothetical protein LBT56_08210 [Prevotellaceae bacterium]|jgi:hypothetical protein|nr:hypothetical protein [Prevotellaceae bacterium]
MKKIILLLHFFISLTANSQTFNKCTYEQLAIFFNRQDGMNVVKDEDNLEDNFIIMPLLNDSIFLDYKIQIYPISPKHIEDSSVGIIFVEKDSIDVYNINMLDFILKKIMSFSNKYPKIFDSEITLSLINDILKIHSNCGRNKILIVNEKKCEHIIRIYH